MIQQKHSLSNRHQEDHWISLSDLMSGLLMFFMLIAFVFMVQSQREAKKSKEQAAKGKSIVTLYQNMRLQLFDDLYAEFKEDLPKWRANLNRDLSLRFEEPNVQFDTGQSNLRAEFKDILKSFIPRYVKILNSEKYNKDIDEVRIEGHTSSLWKGLEPEQAYYQNMRLSQERSRAVLEFVFSLPEVRNTGTIRWLVDKLTANGLSSAKVVRINEAEDTRLSQRVEFRVKTKSDERLEDILKALSQ